MAGSIETPTPRPALRSRAEAQQLVLDVLRANAESLLRLARRHSLCLDDAHDAYQRAVEIFLRHAQTLDEEDAHKWLHTVLKHEAMRLRRTRVRMVGDDTDLDGYMSASVPTPDEQVASFDRLTRSAEALQRLKPQELRALWLSAQGHSYEEIAELCDWSATKVNRCITEGRRSFIDRFADIGSGVECRRWEPVLSAMVDREASAEDLARVRPHLRNCPACRAHVRALRESSLGLAALLPVPAVLAIGDSASAGDGVLARLVEAVTSPIHERAVLSAVRLQNGIEAALPGKLALVAASAAAVAGGGVAVQQAVTSAPRPAAKHLAASRAVIPRPVGTVAQAPRVVASAAPRSGALSRRAAARRTTTTEFHLTEHRAAAASRSTAAREFAPAPTATAAAAFSSSSRPAVAPATRAGRTAAAEFGGG